MRKYLFPLGLVLAITFLIGFIWYTQTPKVSINTQSPTKGDFAVIRDTRESIEEAIYSYSHEVNLNGNIMFRIAKCESSLREFTKTGEVLRGLDNPLDIGIFQLNEKYWLEVSRLIGYDIYSVDGNIQMAVWIAKNYGYQQWGWSSWCWQR